MSRSASKTSSLRLSTPPLRGPAGPGTERAEGEELEKLLAPNSFLLLVVRMLLVVRPGAPSSVLAPSSDARSP